MTCQIARWGWPTLHTCHLALQGFWNTMKYVHRKMYLGSSIIGNKEFTRSSVDFKNNSMWRIFVPNSRTQNLRVPLSLTASSIGTSCFQHFYYYLILSKPSIQWSINIEMIEISKIQSSILLHFFNDLFLFAVGALMYFTW